MSLIIPFLYSSFFFLSNFLKNLLSLEISFRRELSVKFLRNFRHLFLIDFFSFSHSLSNQGLDVLLFPFCVRGFISAFLQVSIRRSVIFFVKNRGSSFPHKTNEASLTVISGDFKTCEYFC